MKQIRSFCTKLSGLRRGSAVWRTVYLLPCFLSFLILDLSFRFIYFGMTFSGKADWCYVLFSISWSLIFTGIVCALPGTAKRIVMLLLSAVFSILAVVHGVMLNMFRHFFSFSDMAFAGDGAAFMSADYLIIRKLAVLMAAGCFLLMLLAAFLAPRKSEGGSGLHVMAGLTAMMLGVVCVLGVRTVVIGKTENVVVWDGGSNPAALYESFSSSPASMRLTGLYQYTFRDAWLSLGLNAADVDTQALDEWYAAQTAHEGNEMTGVLEGKNLLLIQLEAIDTWMLQAAYMPNLAGLKEESLVFENHYTPAYITAGTFNTEFMVNTGLLPAESGTSTGVYSRNSYPFSLANLFSEKGYTARSFHGSEGTIYNREAIHAAWGYEKYYSGSDMEMDDYTLDSQLINGFTAMTECEPFFSLVITISGHGPYDGSSAASNRHMSEALLAAERSEESYLHAVAHAMETDAFIGALVDSLRESGLLESTALVFYADHYNYYMLNDALNMEIKGVDNLNMLQHTDFFIWSSGLPAQRVGKITSSVDVLPTLSNLFGLALDYRYACGYDAFSEDGGYVFFADGAWFDGVYHTAGEDAAMYAEISQRRAMNADALACDYFR